jgi:hypothetical protein
MQATRALLATLAAAATAALAATTPPAGTAVAHAPAASACAAPELHQFDFWIGDWDAFDADDPRTPIARTRITTIASGCAIHELYEQSDGLIGDSILAFDPLQRAWQQTWVTNRGSLMVVSGRLVDGALVLEGEMHVANGTSLRQRITWKSEGEAVRESATISRDGGRSWQQAFDVVFRKHHGDRLPR